MFDTIACTGSFSISCSSAWIFALYVFGLSGEKTSPQFEAQARAAYFRIGNRKSEEICKLCQWENQWKGSTRLAHIQFSLKFSRLAIQSKVKRMLSKRPDFSPWLVAPSFGRQQQSYARFLHIDAALTCSNSKQRSANLGGPVWFVGRQAACLGQIAADVYSNRSVE